MLTGGGDCPGLNAVIRAVARRSFDRGYEVVAVHDGWRGLVDGRTTALTARDVSGLLPRGGTILGTSRTNPYKSVASVRQLVENFRNLQLTALVAIGGDDTLGVARRLYEEEHLPVVGVPKTIDNDLGCTDFTFGFDTSINIVMEAVDRLRTTAESHRRVMVIETMGRHAGWIACFAGIATAADFVLVPEIEVDIETGVYRLVDYLAVVDVGTVMHPNSLGGQIHGGGVQGFGHVRSQKLVYDPHYGAALANRQHGRLSVNVQCDGDLNYAPGVLWTAAHHRIPLLTVMHNNRAYHQERMFITDVAAKVKRDVRRAGVGNDLTDPNIDYASLARAYGVHGFGPIENPNDLGPALKRAIDVVKRGEPALVDVVTQGR